MPHVRRLSESPATYLLRFLKGEPFMESLQSFCNEQKITWADLRGIGSFLSSEIGFYDLETKQYQFEAFGRTMEVASLLGNIGLVEGSPFAHVHVVLSDESCQTIGGHLKEALVGATCEVVLTAYPQEISRKEDPEIGLKLLEI